MPAYIGITIGGSLESLTPGMAVVSSTTVSTGKDIELVLNTWPATPVTKNQVLLALSPTSRTGEVKIAKPFSFSLCA
jgi:hypothetical protein